MPYKKKQKTDTESQDKPLKQSKLSHLIQKKPLTTLSPKKKDSKNKMPISPATCRKWIGAHVSISGGLHMAVKHTLAIKGHAFGLFLKNQRRWDSSPLSKSAIDDFHNACQQHDFIHPWNILPHGSYLINLASPDNEKRAKSFDAFLDDLLRCEQLGISLYNFHPGSTTGSCTMSQSIQHVSDSINMAHSKTSKVIVVVENMSGQGNIVGSKFEELASIIDLVKDKTRIGICLDTCHLFAAGYDIRTVNKFDNVMKDFDRIIGLKYLKAIHLNDSKEGLGDHKDRHENIGKGKLGLECFKFIMNDDRFNDIPMILETPVSDSQPEIYQSEIELLYSLVEK